MHLGKIATRAMEAALAAGAGDAEAYVEDSTGREIRIFDGEVESLTEAGQRGAGVRVWIDGRVGYAYGTDLGEAGIADIAAGAVEAARVADPDEHAAAPSPDGAAAAIEGIFDPALAEWETKSKVELAQSIEAAARATDPRVVGVETTVYADEESRVALASSTGLAGAFEATSCYAFLQAIAADEEGDRQTGLGFGLGRSPFAGRLGDAVAAAALTLTDDGTDPAGLGSAPIDAEGAPRGRTALIDAGRLAAYLHDSYTARREGGGTRSTASASRAGYRSPPSVSTSNLIVAAGERSFEELLADADGGVYVTDVAGLHSGVNPVSGSFSVGATGRLIAGGELAEAADEFTIASDLESMLKNLAAAGRTARWVPFGGSVLTPPLLIAEMAVGGS